MIGVEIPSLINTLQEYKRRGRSITEEFLIHNLLEARRAFALLPVELHGPPNVTKTSEELQLQPHNRSIVDSSLVFVQSFHLNLINLSVPR